MNISLILLSAGSSTRFGNTTKKHWLRIGNDPLWVFVTKNFKSQFDFQNIIITASEDEASYMSNFVDDEIICVGGATRQESLKNALTHVKSEFVLVSDVARVCVDGALIKRLLEFDMGDFGCVTPYVHAVDTTLDGESPLVRENLKLIQTPQLSKTHLLKHALETNQHFTDDSTAVASLGEKIGYVFGDKEAMKLTYADELKKFSCLNAPANEQFVGIGFDVHGFETGKTMVLGGVLIDAPYGFKAHSDGDVLIHALIDGMLGAIGAGDIGEWFPDTSAKYKNIDSALLLTKIDKFVKAVGYEIVNIDITVMAQKPRLSQYKLAIRERLAEILHLQKRQINIKATTTEKLGFVGREEGVAVQSVVNLRYFNWEQKR